MPKIGYTAEDWLTPLDPNDVFEPRLPGFNIPLRISDSSVEEMSRRNVTRPIIPTKPANPARNRSSEDRQQPKEKRQRPSEDVSAPNVSQSVPPVDSRALARTEKEIAKEQLVTLVDPETESSVRRHFSPSYTMADGRVLLLKDSVKEEPNLAVTLLRGLALPRDYDQVPTDLIPGLGEMCSHLVQVSPFYTSRVDSLFFRNLFF